MQKATDVNEVMNALLLAAWLRVRQSHRHAGHQAQPRTDSVICVRKYIAHVDSFEKTNQVKLERDFYSTSEEPDEISRNANLFLATIFSLSTLFPMPGHARQIGYFAFIRCGYLARLLSRILGRIAFSFYSPYCCCCCFVNWSSVTQISGRWGRGEPKDSNFRQDDVSSRAERKLQRPSR